MTTRRTLLRSVPLALASVAIIPAVQPAWATTLPSDITPKTQHYPAIIAALKEGIFGKLPDGKFYPTQPMTRADVARVLYASRDDKTPRSWPKPYAKDVPASHPDYEAIQWLIEKDVPSFFTDWTLNFYPDRVLNRAEMMGVLYGVCNHPDYTPAAYIPFTDVRPGTTCYKQVWWAKDSKIAEGWKDGTFHPELPVTRAAFCTFLLRYKNRYGEVV